MAIQRREEDASKIQARMYDEAAKIYERYTGKRLNRLGGGFDPLVYMLLGACASEFERLSLDINGSWTRVLEHMAKLLTPEVHTGSKPGHGIAFARSISSSCVTESQDQVWVPNHREKDIFFSPTGKFRLFNGSVKYMASDNTLYEMVEGIEKRDLIRTLPGKAFNPYVVWIGLEVPKKDFSVEDISFFWDWDRTKVNVNPMEFLLSTSWEHQGQTLEVSGGLPLVKDSERSRETYPIGDEFHLARSLEREINLIYNDQFLQAGGLAPDQWKREAFPPSFSRYFNADELGELKQPLIWFKMSFSPVFFDANTARQVLKKALCQINCFPIANRKLLEKSFNLNSYINLFELESKGFFLGIEQVLSSRLKKAYQEMPFLRILDDKETSVKSYAIRKSGVNRFDNRDAKAVLKNLIQFVREENYIFSALGRGVVSNNIKTIDRALNDMEGKLWESQKNGKSKEPNASEPGVYIAFPKGIRENVMVSYWSCEGFASNFVRAGTTLELYSDSPWDKGSIRLVTETQGGQDPKEEMARLHEFKSALITRNRVVTKADIEALCYDELGDQLRAVRIQPGVAIGIHAKEGLRRTLEVTLIPRETLDLEKWEYVRKKLESQLNAQAATLMPIRVHLSNPKS
ncbi:MAG: hypothetical protein AAGA10_02395 [Bacteroidota bacterium]